MNIEDIIEQYKEVHNDINSTFIFEMASIKTQDSGLPYRIMVSNRPQNKKLMGYARIKVFVNDEEVSLVFNKVGKIIDKLSGNKDKLKGRELKLYQLFIDNELSYLYKLWTSDPNVYSDTDYVNDYKERNK